MLSSYIVIDLETTGLNPKLDKIIEIGAVKIRDGMEIARFESYVNPGRRLPERITELTGIRDEEVATAPTFGELMEDLLAFLGTEVLIGHNILFDFSFLKRAMVNAGTPFERCGIDTLKISRIHDLNRRSHRLADLCAEYGIEIHNHRALSDALATDALYRRFCKEYEQAVEKAEDRSSGAESADDLASGFAPCPLLYQVKKESPATPAQLERLARIVAERNITIEYELKSLSKNEASRLLDRIRSGDYVGR